MKRKFSRKLVGLAMAVLLVLALPVQALADYYIDDGDISVSASDSGQEVRQNANTYNHSSNDNIKISQRDSNTSTSYKITIESQGDATAKVTIENVNISTGSGSGINVTDGSKAEVTVQGENTVRTRDRDAAAVHVGSGELTLTGGKEGQLTTDANCGAGIGSNGNMNDGESGEAMAGKITVSGDLTVEARSGVGAGIGSGGAGEMSGTVTIEDGAKVSAGSDLGASIGSGVSGDLSGSITVQDGATVTGGSGGGAGIGSGLYGDISEDGSITIKDATVTANGAGGAGIGSGQEGVMNGDITIQDSKVTVLNYTGDGTPIAGSIGAGFMGEFGEKGSIAIKGNSDVTMQSKNLSGGALTEDGIIGAVDSTKSKGSFEIDSTAKLNGENITDLEQLRGKYGLDVDSGRVTISVASDPDVKPEEQGEEEYKPGMRLYWVMDENGKGVTSKVSRKDSVMTVTAELETASFVTTQWGLSELEKQGVKTITFVTSGATSSFDVAEALADLASGSLVLQHKGGEASLTLGGVEHNELLK